MSKEPNDKPTPDDFGLEDFGLEEYDLGEEELSEEEMEEEVETQKEKKAQVRPKRKEEKTAEVAEEPAKESKEKEDDIPTVETDTSINQISRDDITISLSIEVGRVNIPMDKLLQLQEGNTLDLSIKPETGVDLVVNGQCIGKGELIKIGENIGIRVLDIQ